jgi:hypothetical protein
LNYKYKIIRTWWIQEYWEWIVYNKLTTSSKLIKRWKRINELCNCLPWCVGWDGSCFSINKCDCEASFFLLISLSLSSTYDSSTLIYVYIYTCYMLMSFENLDKSRSKISQNRRSLIWRWMNENKTPRSKERILFCFFFK